MSPFVTFDTSRTLHSDVYQMVSNLTVSFGRELLSLAALYFHCHSNLYSVIFLFSLFLSSRKWFIHNALTLSLTLLSLRWAVLWKKHCVNNKLLIVKHFKLTCYYEDLALFHTALAIPLVSSYIVCLCLCLCLCLLCFRHPYNLTQYSIYLIFKIERYKNIWKNYLNYA